MKKLLLSVLSFVMLTASASFSFTLAYAPISAHTSARTFAPAALGAVDVEDQFLETYFTAIQRLIFPMLQHEVQLKYGDLAHLDIWDTEILSFDQMAGGEYILKVRIKPFTGPHNTIAVVDVSIHCSPKEVRINKFDIIKIYNDDIQLLD